MNTGAGLVALLHAGAPFSWSTFTLHPSVVLGCAFLAVVYLSVVRRVLGHVPAGKAALALGGLLLVFLALDGPLHDLSDNYLFSAHMVQHMLLTLAVPPLLIAGMPGAVVDRALEVRGVEPVARVLTHPAAAFAVYNLVYIGWHFPGAYNLALEIHALHIVQHLMFISASVMMWWPLMSPTPRLATLTPPMKLLYIFAFGIPVSVVAAFVTMASHPLYPWYEAAPRIFRLSALEDQQMAGAIMWVPGAIIYWIAMSIVFLKWANREERELAKASGAAVRGQIASAT